MKGNFRCQRLNNEIDFHCQKSWCPFNHETFVSLRKRPKLPDSKEITFLLAKDIQPWNSHFVVKKPDHLRWFLLLPNSNKPRIYCRKSQLPFNHKNSIFVAKKAHLFLMIPPSSYQISSRDSSSLHQIVSLFLYEHILFDLSSSPWSDHFSLRAGFRGLLVWVSSVPPPSLSTSLLPVTFGGLIYFQHQSFIPHDQAPIDLDP